LNTIDWDIPNPHLFHTEVSAEHIDGLNHTNNAVYVTWCEQCAWSHSAELGLNLAAYQKLGRAMAITHAEYFYLKASNLGDQIIAATWIVGWDKKLSMDRNFQIVRATDGATLLRANMRFVCIDIDSGRPRRLPPEFIAGYGPAISATE